MRRCQGRLAFCATRLSTPAPQVLEWRVGVVREHALEPRLRLLLLLAGAAGAPPPPRDPEAARRGGQPFPAAPAVEESRRGEDREARCGRDGRARS